MIKVILIKNDSITCINCDKNTIFISIHLYKGNKDIYKNFHMTSQKTTSIKTTLLT